MIPNFFAVEGIAIFHYGLLSFELIPKWNAHNSVKHFCTWDDERRQMPISKTMKLGVTYVKDFAHFTCSEMCIPCPYALPWIAGSPLTALHKKSGSFHPTAVGETVHCLASCLGCGAFDSFVLDIFFHITWFVWESMEGLRKLYTRYPVSQTTGHAEENLCCLNVDMKNVFNECA